MGCDPEVCASLAAISHVATRSQRGCLNLDRLTPPFVPFHSVRRMRNAFSYVVKINIPISSFDDQLVFQVSSPPVLLSIQGKRKNRVWQRTPRQGMMKKRLSIHSNASVF